MCVSEIKPQVAQLDRLMSASMLKRGPVRKGNGRHTAECSELT